MQTQLDLRRILIYLAIAYGLAVAATIAVVLTGGMEHSPTLFMIGQGPVTLALVILALPYMYAPAIGHVLTRLITREGWSGTLLRLHFRQGWRRWLLALVHPPVLTLLGAALFFLVQPKFYDPGGSFVGQQVRKAIEQSGQSIPPSAVPVIILTNAVIGILFGTVINCFFTFGEEFGWRSYLLTKLMPLGWRRAMLWMGLIWGTWHWPILYLGYNYTLNIPGAPWSGMAAFILFTFAAGTVLAWLVLKAGSVWPAVIGHAAINASAGLGVLMASGEPNRLLGPLPFGLIAVLPWLVLALWLLFRPGELALVQPSASDNR